MLAVVKSLLLQQCEIFAQYKQVYNEELYMSSLSSDDKKLFSCIKIICSSIPPISFSGSLRIPLVLDMHTAAFYPLIISACQFIPTRNDHTSSPQQPPKPSNPSLPQPITCPTVHSTPRPLFQKQQKPSLPQHAIIHPHNPPGRRPRPRTRNVRRYILPPRPHRRRKSLRRDRRRGRETADDGHERRVQGCA